MSPLSPWRRAEAPCAFGHSCDGWQCSHIALQSPAAQLAAQLHAKKGIATLQPPSLSPPCSFSQGSWFFPIHALKTLVGLNSLTGLGSV